MITLTISDSNDLAGIAGETARHNKNFGTALTPQQFFENIAVANMLRSWRHNHVDQTAEALKDRLQVVESEKVSAEQRAATAEQRATTAEAALKLDEAAAEIPA